MVSLRASHKLNCKFLKAFTCVPKRAAYILILVEILNKRSRYFEDKSLLIDINIVYPFSIL